MKKYSVTFALYAAFIFCTDVQSKIKIHTDTSEVIPSVSQEEEEVLEILSTLITIQENALSLTADLNNSLTLVRLYSIEMNLNEALKEEKILTKLYQEAKSKLSSDELFHMNTIEQQKLETVNKNRMLIFEKETIIKDLIKARNLALNSNLSVKESIKAIQWLKGINNDFHNNIYEILQNKTIPALQKHAQAFGRNPTRKKAIKIINELIPLKAHNRSLIVQEIKKTTTQIAENWGHNKPLHSLLKKSLQPVVRKIEHALDSIQTFIDKLEHYIKITHP